MKNRRSAWLKIVAFSLVLVSAVLVLSSPLNYAGVVQASAASDSKVQSYEDRIAALKNDQKNYEKLIKEAQKDAAAFLKEKEYLDKQIENLNEQITVSNNLLIEYKNAIAAKEEEITAKQSEYDTKFAQYKTRLRVSYEDGAMGYLVMLLTSKSISEFLTSLERMINMLEYDNRTMKSLNEEKTVLTGEKDNLEKLKENQQTVYNELEKTNSSLKNKSDKAAKYYQTEIQNEAALEKKLAALQAQEKKANAELDAYLAELAKKNNGVYSGGSLSWPLPSNQNKITSRFGPRTYKIWGRVVSENHRGLDISIPTGTPVYACADGTVEKSQWNGSYGYYIVISHGSGYTTLYAHNSSLVVRQGQRVKRGDLLAYSGSTGNSTGPHLHLEIAINGVLQNPLTNGLLSHPSLKFYC